MLQPAPLSDLPPFSDTAAASIRRQLAARRLCDLGVDATGLLEAGRLRPAAAALLTVENSYRAVQAPFWGVFRREKRRAAVAVAQSS